MEIKKHIRLFVLKPQTLLLKTDHVWYLHIIYKKSPSSLSCLTNSIEYDKWHVSAAIVCYMTQHEMMMNERLCARVISPQYHRADTGFIESLCLEDLLQFRESPVDFFGESHLYVSFSLKKSEVTEPVLHWTCTTLLLRHWFNSNSFTM